MKTRKELQDIVMLEVRTSGKCDDLESVFVVGPLDRRYSNWDIGAPSTHSTKLVSATCLIELNEIVARLQMQYDLDGRLKTVQDFRSIQTGSLAKFALRAASSRAI